MRPRSKTFPIEQSDPRITSKKSSFSTECAGIGLLDRKSWGSKKAIFFNSIRKPCFRPETGLFDPRIRLHKDWRVVRIDQQQQLAPYSHAVVVEPRTNNRKLSVSSARASQANVYARTKKPVDPYVQYTLTRPAVSYHTSAR